MHTLLVYLGVIQNFSFRLKGGLIQYYFVGEVNTIHFLLGSDFNSMFFFRWGNSTNNLVTWKEENIDTNALSLMLTLTIQIALFES